MTTSNKKKLHFAAALALFFLTIFSITSVSKHGPAPLAIGLVFLLGAGHSFLAATGRASPEQNFRKSLQRLTRFYIKVVGIFLLLVLAVTMVSEAATVDLKFVVSIIVFGSLGAAIWGPVFFVTIVLPGWAIYRLARRILRNPG